MAARSSLPYEIGRFHAVCDRTETPLKPGEFFYAALVDTDDAELTRLNICSGAWESGDRPDRVFAYWRAIVHEPDHKPDDVIDHDSLLSLFESIDPEDDDETRGAFRFVLALMLQRKRILMPAPGANDPALLSLVPRSNKEAEPYAVPVPELDADALMGLTDQLRGVLNLGEES